MAPLALRECLTCLQCGRAHVSAETYDLAVLGMIDHSAPSMWPRSRERGNSCSARSIVESTPYLQCGRAHVSAETLRERIVVFWINALSFNVAALT